eukprot:2646139-Prorocentrum_lima.AAC.1
MADTSLLRKESQDKLMAGSQALSAGNQAMLPEPSSCTPRSPRCLGRTSSSAETSWGPRSA